MKTNAFYLSLASISSTLNVQIFHTNVCFVSFYNVHVTRKKLPKWRLYEKSVHFTLMKLTPPIRRITSLTRKCQLCLGQNNFETTNSGLTQLSQEKQILDFQTYKIEDQTRILVEDIFQFSNCKIHLYSFRV